jgi:hypothetical protein
MTSRHSRRDVRFTAEDGYLVRTVTICGRASGPRTYTHRCTKRAFESVAHALAETPAEGQGTSLGDIAEREQLPFTQANVALEFLKERGLVDVRHRRCCPASCGDLYLDAMVEFYALAEKLKTGAD